VRLSGRGFRSGDSRDRRADPSAALAKLLTLLFEVTALLDMTTRAELVGCRKQWSSSKGRRENSILS
jgi:hypothetical protein